MSNNLKIMKFKLLALVVSSLVLAPIVVVAEPIWVNLGYSQNNDQLWIDHQSVARYKSVVSFNMRLESPKKVISSKVAADCNTLTFQYQNLATNNIASPPPNGIGFPIQEAQPDSVLGTAIYYACATYQRSTF